MASSPDTFHLNATAPPPFPGTRPWRLYSIGYILFIIAGFTWIRHGFPMPLSIHPKCILFQLTHIYCPGCGTSRALYALAHGHFLRALDLNILTVCCVVALACWSVPSLWRSLVYNVPPVKWSLPNGTVKCLLYVIVGFTILRNIPLVPFSWLNPDVFVAF